MGHIKLETKQICAGDCKQAVFCFDELQVDGPTARGGLPASSLWKGESPFSGLQLEARDGRLILFGHSILL